MKLSTKTAELVKESSSMRARYVHFCRNPFRTEEEITHEFDLLSRTPGIDGVAFFNDHTLMVGTKHIYITDPDTKVEHDVGKFVIFIIRRHLNPEWRVQFRFGNITHDHLNFSRCMHPHIKEHQFDEIAYPTGKLCISHGQYPLFQFIRKGEVHKAVPVFLRILYSYDAFAPWLSLDNWPRKKKRWQL